VTNAFASARSIHPRNELSKELEEIKTDRGKNERFSAKKWRKKPIERNQD
jgi:hypothetical protein